MNNWSTLRKFLTGGLLGLLLSFPLAWVNYADAGLKAVAALNQAAVSITGGTLSSVTISTSNVPTVLAKWGVPCGLASSGTMGDNGAASGMTALPTTYSGGIWLYIPAGAIAAGEPAAPAFRWFKASSTTAGTFYNSTWDGSGIPPLGTDTPYVTTGPGAFTGVSSGEITCATVTVPAGAMGPTGAVRIPVITWNYNTAAGNKIPRIRYSGGAGTILLGPTVSTSAPALASIAVRNRGVAGGQTVTVHGATNASAGVAYTAVDTAAATTLVFTLEKATATNHVILEGAEVQLVYGP